MRVKLCLIACILYLAPLIAYAQDLRQTGLQALYVKSGLEKQLQQFPLLIQAGVDQALMTDSAAKKLPRNIVSAIRRAISDAFVPAHMKELLLHELSERLSDEDMRKVLEWLNSSTGTKCTLLEEAATTPEAFAEIQSFAREVQSAPPPKERVEVLKELDVAVGATKGAVAIALNTQVAVAVTILGSFPTERQRPLDDILSEVEKARPAIEAAIGPQVMMSFLYAYRTLSMSELQAYVEFARSPEGVKYHAASNAGMQAVFLEGTVSLAKAIKTAIEDAKGKADL